MDATVFRPSFPPPPFIPLAVEHRDGYGDLFDVEAPLLRRRRPGPRFGQIQGVVTSHGVQEDEGCAYPERAVQVRVAVQSGIEVTPGRVDDRLREPAHRVWAIRPFTHTRSLFHRFIVTRHPLTSAKK